MQIPLKQYWILLQKYLQHQWKTALLLAGALLSNIAILLINPQIIRQFIDAAQSGQEKTVLYRAALIFLGLGLAQQLMSVLAGYLGEVVAWTATNNLRVDLAAHCLSLDLSFHNTHTPGEMIERVDGDINNLANFFSRFVVELFGNLLLMVGVLILMWRESWLIGLGLTTFVALSMYIMLRYRNVAVPHMAAERQASADFYGFLEERLSGTEDIRALGSEAYVLRNFHALIREMLKKSLRSAMVINVIININQFLFAVGTAAAFAIGTYLFQRHLITIGAVYLVYHYTAMLTHPLDNIAHQVDQLQRAGAGIIRIQQLFAIKSKICDKYPIAPEQSGLQIASNKVVYWQPHLKAEIPLMAGLQEDNHALGLSFEDVTFGYQDSFTTDTIPNTKSSGVNGQNTKEIVLRNVSFTLEPGQVLGLLGRTGSGKTTLTRMIFRFYDPDQGSVSVGVNGLSAMSDIRDLPLGFLRKQVGMVTQDIQLFNASVRDNLTFFDRSIPDNQIENVIFELGLSGWFNSLPERLDTLMEYGGTGLSAGEAQLLAFARVFLVDPGLVVLDEASSRLDPATEALLDQAIRYLIKNRTAIIIAHHLNTVQKADKIMILDQGSIQEFGDRKALLKNPDSRFSQLMKKGLDEVLV